MKKYGLLFCLVCLASFSFAEVSLRMDGPESVVVITSDEMEKALFLEKVVAALDDEDEDDDNDIKEGQSEGVTLVAPAETETKAGKTDLPVRFLPNVPFISKHAADFATGGSITSADLEDAFDEYKGKMIVDIRAVNWKTGYNISMRDKTVWQRIKYVLGRCSVLASSIPSMSFLGEEITAETWQSIAEQGSQKIAESMECAIFDAKLKSEIHYTLEGLYFEIITKKPFLLLTLNDAVYEALEEKEKEILQATGKTMNDRLLGVLVKNMARFFDLRAKFELMNNDFRDNTQKIYKSSKISTSGDGSDAWSTYKILADHAIRMNNALAQHVLSDNFEESSLTTLKKTLMMISDDAKINRSTESVIRKDPQNMDLVTRIDTEFKHTRDRKAEEQNKAKNSAENDKELILRAYKKD